MLTELRIQGFKSWRDTGTLRLAPITAFFGPNSSGKSSLLQFLLMLKQTAASADRVQVLELGGQQTLVDLGTYDDILFRSTRKGLQPAAPSPGEDRVNRLQWQMGWKLDQPFEIKDPEDASQALFKSDTVRFETILRLSDDEALHVERMSYRFGSASFGMEEKKDKQHEARYELVTNNTHGFRPKRTPGRAWDLPAPAKYYGFPDQARGYYQNTAFLSDLELLLERMLGSIHYLGPLRESPARDYTWTGSEPADMGRRGERAIAAILASKLRRLRIPMGKGAKRRTLEEHVAYWLRELGLIATFRVEEISKGSRRYRVRVQKERFAPEVSLTDVGFGISQVLPVLVLAFYAPEGSIIILEQPELHLHPAVQAGLADVLIDAVNRRGVQLIIESHSEHLLLRLQRRIAEGKFDADNAALYFCALENGASRVRPLDLGPDGTIRNWPKNFFGDSLGERAAAVKAGFQRRTDDAA